MTTPPKANIEPQEEGRSPVVAVDFDGTIVYHLYPDTSLVERVDNGVAAVSVLKRLQEAGVLVVVWTCREGDLLNQAVHWLISKGFTADGYNENAVVCDGFAEHKVLADWYFDDRGWPPFPGWDAVEREFLR